MFEQQFLPYHNHFSSPSPSGFGGLSAQQLQVLYAVVRDAWFQNYSLDQILTACRLYLPQGVGTVVEALADYIEINERPPALTEEAFRIQIGNTYRCSPTVEAFQKLVDSTKNLYLKDLAQQGLEKVKEAGIKGRLPVGNFTLASAEKIVLQEQVSVLIFGNSGAGKTSVSIKLISVISRNLDKPVQVLVLDPHLNDWGTLPIVSEPEEIVRTLDCLVRELIRRRNDWKRQVRELPPEERAKNWPYLIIVWDEIDDALTFAATKEAKLLIKREKLFHPADALRLLGAQLRKFEGCLIGMNQSRNCDALDLDSNQRSNFVDIDLCESALNQASTLWKGEQPERLFIESKRQGYPCLVRSRPALHPTHAHYTVRQNKQPPMAFEAPITEPWSINIPAEPIVFRGDLSEVFQAETISPKQSLSEIGLEEDDEDEDVWGSKQDYLYQLYREIKKGRTAQPPRSKTDICNGWEGNTERKFRDYDEALLTYANEWLEEFVKDDTLSVNLDSLVSLFWGLSNNRNNKKARNKINLYKRELKSILEKMNVHFNGEGAQLEGHDKVISLREYRS
ncbi:MAG: hypothetical protein F6K58_10645 [Symploca sp. SIO2E9]|nr:hypothetical protein [Symploca sp. SIO2E9]